MPLLSPVQKQLLRRFLNVGPALLRNLKRQRKLCGSTDAHFEQEGTEETEKERTHKQQPNGIAWSPLPLLPLVQKQLLRRIIKVRRLLNIRPTLLRNAKRQRNLCSSTDAHFEQEGTEETEKGRTHKQQPNGIA